MRAARWLREHGWIVPVAYVLLAIVFGLVLPRVDRANPGLHFLGALAVEQLLAAIASGMIAFTGIVLSISFWPPSTSNGSSNWRPGPRRRS